MLICFKLLGENYKLPVRKMAENSPPKNSFFFQIEAVALFKKSPPGKRHIIKYCVYRNNWYPLSLSVSSTDL